MYTLALSGEAWLLEDSIRTKWMRFTTCRGTVPMCSATWMMHHDIIQAGWCPIAMNTPARPRRSARALVIFQAAIRQRWCAYASAWPNIRLACQSAYLGATFVGEFASTAAIDALLPAATKVFFWVTNALHAFDTSNAWLPQAWPE